MAGSPQHRQQSRPNFRARQLGTLLLLVALLAMAVFVGARALGHASPTSTTTTSTTTTLPPTTTTTVDPGGLPQTLALPPSSNASLEARLMPLWHAIQSDNLGLAQSVFFPESAYVSMKTGQIPNPQSDYALRLLAFLKLDLATYHQALGTAPMSVPLLEVLGQPSNSTLIQPNTCENNVAYWYQPRLRLVYRIGGEIHSFGIASVISWRGVWYVIHLGPNPRPYDVGTLDLPAVGTGAPGPPGGC